jgi:hypothetical protein
MDVGFTQKILKMQNQSIITKLKELKQAARFWIDF